MGEGDLHMTDRNELTKLMKDLSETDGVPGFEREVRLKMKEYLEPVSSEILQDRLGGIVGKKAGAENGPRILLAGHLDEIGWMVTHITDTGYIKFHQLGGWWSHVMLSQRVKIKSRKGDIIGLVGSKAPHALSAEERDKVQKQSDLFIDLGARDKAHAQEMGIRPGDWIVPVSEFMTMRDGELWAGKALDNRLGCALALEVMKRLEGEQHDNIVYGGATVQEEVGTRGAQVMANLVQPDIAFALDVGLAYDHPGYDTANLSPANVGGGPLIFIYDAHMIAHQGLRDLVMDTAEELGLPYQVQTMVAGGTDGAKFHLNGIGCPTLAFGFATRYIHSHTAVASAVDFENAVTLLTEVVKKLNRAKVDELQSF